MKHILFTMMLILALQGLASAAVVVSDYYSAIETQPAFFMVTMDTGNQAQSNPEVGSGGTVRFTYDVGWVAVGTHTLYVFAVAVDPIYGNLTSATVSFTFSRPGTPPIPTGLAIEKIGDQYYLVCAAYPASEAQPSEFLVTIDSGTPVPSAAQVLTGGSKRLYYNITSLLAGTHTARVRAVIPDDGVWGRFESADSSPFTLRKTAPPRAPATLRLSR